LTLIPFLASVKRRHDHFILKRLYHRFDDPDYNYMIHSAPYQEDPADYYHWHLQILPKLYKVAVFELGSGIYLNSASPEENAKYLKEVTTDVSE